MESSYIWGKRMLWSKWINGFLNGFALNTIYILFFIPRPQSLSLGIVLPTFSKSKAYRLHCQEALCNNCKFSLLQFHPFSPFRNYNPSLPHTNRRMVDFSFFFFFKLLFSSLGRYRENIGNSRQSFSRLNRWEKVIKVIELSLSPRPWKITALIHPL